MGVGQKVPRPHEKRTIVMKYTTGLPTPKFADLLIRLREEGVEGYPPSGAAGVFEGGADLHASQHSAGGDRRTIGCVPAHCLAGHRCHDRVKSLGVVFFRSGGDGGQGGAVAGAVVGLEHVGQVSQ